MKNLFYPRKNRAFVLAGFLLIASSCEEYAILEVPAAPADEQLVTLAEANN
ncbi:MAG: hypothetical protein ACLFT3_18290 [Cyclobacteriaceae bacterium]